MAKQSEFLRSGIFHHELTSTLLGGPMGIKWAALLLVRFFWSLRTLVHGGDPPCPSDIERDYKADLRVVELDIEWLHTELKDSIGGLTRARKAAPTRLISDIAAVPPWIKRVELPEPTQVIAFINLA